MYKSIYSKISEANDRYVMFDGSSSVLVALSGGADSVCLLTTLHRFYPDLKLIACHVNHMLRGSEADRDELFVRELCSKLGIELEVLKTDVAAFAKEKGLSTELAARKIRYGFFEDICRKHGVSIVATAHTASDNAETVLFNLTRGTALSGLCGIPPKRALNEDITLIRPLIFATRSDIENFLTENGICYVTDSSNLTDDYTRNYFRHNIIPKLKEINPSFEENLKNTCVSLRDTQIFIEKSANNNMTDSIHELAKLDKCMLSEVIVALYKNSTGMSLIESFHVGEIARFIKKSASENCRFNYEICLPGKISAILCRDKLSFEKTIRDKNKDVKKYSFNLCLGENILHGIPFMVSVYNTENTDIPHGYSLYGSAIIDGSVVSGKLIARNRLDGDTIHHGGMIKKVKELFCKKKLPSAEREALPLICDDDGIVCIPGICTRDKHKTQQITENNKLFIYIYSKTTL